MRFFDSKIVTTPISLGEALDKAKNKPAQKSLDELLGELDKKAQVKTASVAPAVTKVAAVTEEEALAASVSDGEDDTSAVASGEALTLDEAKNAKQAKKEVEQAAAIAPDGAAIAPQPEQAPVAAPVQRAAESKSVKLTVASKIDFINGGWKREDVVKAWKQHGTMEKCMANVKGQTSDPKMYCGLLQVASKKVESAVKTASKKAQPAVFKKIAKLTPEEKSFLKGYFRQLYGEGYVDALLSDY